MIEKETLYFNLIFAIKVVFLGSWFFLSVPKLSFLVSPVCLRGIPVTPWDGCV